MKRARQPADDKVATDSPSSKEPRLPKRKVAVLIGYCGTGYHGMQLNHPHKTIEGDLFDAFCKAGAISKDNSNDPKKSSLIRAARTDKGVHAAGNVISLKLIVEDPDIVAKINSHLPDQIRVWGFSRTNKSFECRKCCSSRIYEYLLPTYTLVGPKPSSAVGQRLAKGEGEAAPAEATETIEFWAKTRQACLDAGFTDEELASLSALGDEEAAHRDRLKQLKAVEHEVRKTYRVGADRLEKLRSILCEYKGVHNFHNFTVGQTYNDRSSIRIMKELSVSEPKIIDGTEWVSIKIHGQSFMLHQIRKMIACAVLCVRFGSPAERVPGLFKHPKLGVPKAPALGLLLEQPVYDGYNKRLEEFGHEQLSFERYQDEMEAFKQKHIYDKIHAQEAKENEFQAFFAYMDASQQSEIMDYLLDGVYPERTKAVAAEPETEAEEKNNEENEG